MARPPDPETAIVAVPCAASSTSMPGGPLSPAVRVAVLMPIWNAAPFVGDAIESVLNQTFTDFEIVIVDDGSTDRSVEIVAGCCDPRIRLIRNEPNLPRGGAGWARRM